MIDKEESGYMGAITKTMIECAYDIGKKVYSGELTRVDGKNQVNRQTSMDIGSANDYINVLIYMLDGNEYHRTINAKATEYYLVNIGLDFGIERQKKAAHAVDLHAKYYAKLNHGHQVRIEELALKFM